MAQTKQASKSKSGSSRKPPASKAAKTRKGSKSGGSPKGGASRSNGGGSRSNGGGSPSAVKKAMTNGVSDAAGLVRKAKVPLMTSGAALAGATGALMLSRSGRRRKLHLPGRNGLKVDARKVAGAVTEAAKQADDLGRRVSRVAHSVQEVGEKADKVAKKA